MNATQLKAEYYAAHEDAARAEALPVSPYWGIVYSTNSNSPRAKRWYHVARVIKVDGMWFEMYWSSAEGTRDDNQKRVRDAAWAAGLKPLDGLFHDYPAPRIGSRLAWSKDIEA